MTALARIEDVAFAYGDLPVFSRLDLEVRSGELVCLVGPNGAGKTTCLHLMLGLARPSRGVVTLGGTDVGQLPRRHIAQLAAYVPQTPRSDFAFTVRDVVAMGRTPYLGRLQPEGPADRQAVDAALAATEAAHLATRLLGELSSGERQRVHVARALAQQTELLLLDEPTSNLDVEHQLHLLDLVRGLVDDGKTAVVALHDLSLAARYADRLVVVAEGGAPVNGPPDAVLREEYLARYFRIRARIDRTSADGRPIVIPVEALGRADRSGHH